MVSADRDDSLPRSYPRAPAFIEEWVRYVRTRSDSFADRRGFLRSAIFRDLSLVPKISRSLYEVEVGKKDLIKATPDDSAVSETARVQVNARPAAGPPYSNDGSWELSDDGGYLTATISVISPNGFHSGVIYGAPSAGASGEFTDRNRIRGDQFAGDYRVVVPWVPRSRDFPLRPRAMLVDQLGITLT